MKPFRAIVPPFHPSHRSMPRWVVLAVALACIGPQTARATTMYDAQGTSAPCVGVSPFGNIVKRCVELMENSGFIRGQDLGATGLTLGTSGKDDGVVTAVAAGSAGAQAGLAVGDALVAINGKPVKMTPGEIVTQRTFGVRGESVALGVRRAGADLTITLVRDPKEAPPGPKSTSRLIYVHPIINWQGQFVPCMGSGPAGPAAIAYCESHFKKDGYIKTGEFGSTGFVMDLANPNKALVATVDPGSAAAKAGLQPGDEIVSVDGQPLSESLGEVASERLFGKTGDQFTLTISTAGQTKDVKLTLTPK